MRSTRAFSSSIFYSLCALLLYACADGVAADGENNANRDVAIDGGSGSFDGGDLKNASDADLTEPSASDAGCASSGDEARAPNLSLGFDHSCWLNDGGVACWGSTRGAIYNGDPQQNPPDWTSPTPVPGLAPGVSVISAGGYMDCVIIDGGVQCWGNVHFPITAESKPTFTAVTVFGPGSGVTAISSGGGHACAIVNGALKCWGANASGQLGDDSTVGSGMTPVDVQGLGSPVTAVSAGTEHTCAIVNGGAQCWGSNVSGELGNGTTTQSLVPVPVIGLQTAVTVISSGDAHTCAITGGAVLCWGANGVGALGDNSTTDRVVPTPVIGLPANMASVSAGYQSTCAITSAGGAMCWGANDFGELGNGSTTNSSTPVPVSGLTTGVTSIGAKGSAAFACATKDGRVLCWGNNDYHQLADGTTNNQSVPGAVSGL